MSSVISGVCSIMPVLSAKKSGFSMPAPAPSERFDEQDRLGLFHVQHRHAGDAAIADRSWSRLVIAWR
jgi:hypothetical protein